MHNNLRVLLILFAIILMTTIFKLISNDKLSIKYSLIWLLSSLVILIVGLFPDFVGIFTNLVGFETTSNLIVGIILVLLLIITLIITIIITEQKKKIKLLIQEVSLLKKEK
jgi:hypothetical protein